MKRRSFVLAAAAAVAPLVARAQDTYPSRPVRIIVPWPGGTGIDVQTRVFAQTFSEALGVPVFIDNKPGAGSHVGYQAALSAKPDGYTLFAGTNAQFIHQYMRPSANIDLLRDMTPVTLLFWLPQVLVVSADSPAQNVQQLVELARAKPGAFNYGSGGVGTGSHMLGAAIATRNNVNIVHVPLHSLSTDLVPMLRHGDIQFSVPVTSLATPFIKAGTVRALAVTSIRRLPQWPDVPTLAEAFNDERYATDSWNGLFVPAGTPAPIVKKVFDAAMKASESPAFAQSARDLLTMNARSKSPAEFADLLKAESVKWRDMVRDSGVKPD